MSFDVNIASKVIKDKGYQPLLISFHENRYFAVSALYKNYVDKDIVVITFNDVLKYMKDIAGVVLIGISGQSGTGAFIDGTNNNLGWHDYLINHKPISESALYAYYFGYYHVPIIFTSGCYLAVSQNTVDFPNATHVITKMAKNRNLAYCLPEEEIVSLLTTRVGEAIDNIALCRPFETKLPLTITIVFNRTDYCDQALRDSNYNFKRLNARTLEKELNDFNSIYNFIY